MMSLFKARAMALLGYEVGEPEEGFNSHEDFCATIACGDNILTDHTLEFDFEKYEVVGDRLNG